MKQNKSKTTARSGKSRAKYSEKSFWNTIHSYFSEIGKSTLKQAFILYCALNDPRTPGDAKIIIVSALAYLILPTDMVPDFIPVVGYTDDAAALLAAINAIGSVVKPEHKREASKQVKDLLG